VIKFSLTLCGVPCAFVLFKLVHAGAQFVVLFTRICSLLLQCPVVLLLCFDSVYGREFRN